MSGTRSGKDGGKPSVSWVSLANGEVVAAAGVGHRLGAIAFDSLWPLIAASVVSVVAVIFHTPLFIANAFVRAGAGDLVLAAVERTRNVRIAA